jgi:hypothetical protein
MTQYSTCEAGELVPINGKCGRCGRTSDKHCGYPPPDPRVEQIKALKNHVAALQKAVDSLVDFGGTVGPSSSYWDDVWPELDAAIDSTRQAIKP